MLGEWVGGCVGLEMSEWYVRMVFDTVGLRGGREGW